MSEHPMNPILIRRSCRHFLSKPLREGDIERLLEAMQQAPSAGNCQPWFVYAVTNRATKECLGQAAFDQTFLVQAPVVFVICAEPERSAARYRERGRTLYCLQDTAAMVENLLIAATALGYGSCWIGAFDEEAAKEALNIPQHLRPVAIVPIGPGSPSKHPAPRRSLSEITTSV